jgi:uncharacterized membrane protein YeiH
MLTVINSWSGAAQIPYRNWRAVIYWEPDYFYATAAFGGDLVFVLLHRTAFDRTACLVVSAGVILALRLAGLRWKLALPVFRTRGE